MYKILVIPGARDGLGGTLDLGAELDRLTTLGMRFDALSVTMLPEGLSELDITDRLAINSTDYDAVHLLGHADDNGFYQNQNEVLTKESIKSICRDAGARTVFINSCSSARMGQYLVNNGMAVAICYAVPVMDQQALINAVRFYAALAKSNDPFQDGIREGYDAADPGDGSLLWLTNGAYVEAIIAPIMERLGHVEIEQGSHFTTFQNALKKIETELGSRVSNLARSTSHTRYAIIAVIAVVILCTVLLVWAASSFSSGLAQSIPPVPTNQGTIPPLPATPPTPVLPTRKPTKTPVPTNQGTIPPLPATPPTPVLPTRKPTKTPLPTSPGTISPLPATPPTPVLPTRKPTKTPLPTRRPNDTPESATITPAPTFALPTPTNTKIPPTATWTEFETVVNLAVQATITAWSGCGC